MPPTHPNRAGRLEAETESFEFLNELALAFRAAENHPHPQCAPVLEGVRAVLAHLTAAGRLIPAGGMALTAEQVEDVRTVAWYTGAGLSRAPMAEIHRLRTLFPATEPAEEAVGDPLQAWKEFLKPKPIGWYRTMTPQFATEYFGFPDGSVLGQTHTASDGGTWGWCGDDWELLVYPPAPAEPAEEETKAEDVTAERLAELIADAPAANYEENDYNAGYVAALISLRDELGEVTRPTAEGSRAVTFDEIAQSLKSFGDAESSFGFKLAYWGKIAEKLIAKYPHVLSSPVIPAPTETGPWQTWQEVPDDVWFTSTSAVGSLPAHRKRGNLVDWQFRDGSVGVYDDSRIGNGKLMARAPFVAAEEG